MGNELTVLGACPLDCPDRGAFPATVEIGDSVPPGGAATTKGHWANLTGGPTVNATVDERDSDMAGGAVYHDNRVEITAAPR